MLETGMGTNEETITMYESWIVLLHSAHPPLVSFASSIMLISHPIFHCSQLTSTGSNYHIATAFTHYEVFLAV